jgi:tetratricopeptide (TPR) repeat protein
MTLGKSSGYSSGGIVLSIRKLKDGQYDIRQVGGDWLPFHVENMSFQVIQGNESRLPIVLYEQGESSGVGWYHQRRWVCMYQWQGDSWSGLLDNQYGEKNSSIGFGMKEKEDCFFFEGLGAAPYTEDLPASEYPEIHVEKAVDPYTCDWELDYTFTWDGDRYTPSMELNAVTVEGIPYELFCVHLLWPRLEILTNPQELLVIMQAYETDWPAADPPLYEGSEEKFSNRFDSAYHDSFRFHLGRLYALSGDVDRALQILTELVPGSSSFEELESAQQYLEDLPDVAAAEDHYQMNMKASQHEADLSPDDLLEIYSARLFDGDDVDGVIDELEGLLADPDLVAGTPDDDGRAGLWYFLGLAYEARGEELKAIETYLHLLRSFPDGVYAQAAASRLIRE